MHKENTAKLHEIAARKLPTNGESRAIQRKALQVGYILVGPVGLVGPRFRGRVSKTISVLDNSRELSSGVI